MKAICAVCGRERDIAETVHVSEAMRAAYPSITLPNEYHYCSPCWRLLSDQERGARLLSGMLQSHLSSKGHLDAQAPAKKFYEFLIRKSKGGLVS